ncbi:MAG: zinc-binding dehydrogenase [Candidatus Competibacteraceae bacterium]|nr:zinc-binding dehydrogenase [Candidatus Competibacteraceae bacterium]MBK7983523.1 zinc-binding dehydrogenase [Candidatus Competibacteraceae bacterium]MBK8897937.1 zinc-binding dehydrogenase [Candidatus Competibacteraceae bacterium]MBK8961740.1 zinc-binding dehydrogenase [Candidatus Competibacteraceae bacterium]MBK9950958.1 zinc-binding dehydrogenase [Candidatus Competibacteraceae bacterium]
MKAIVLSKLGGPEQLQLIEVPTPEPGPGQVRVRLRASALNRRDVWITLNQYPKIRLPAIMGSDGAGVIDKLGADAPSGLLGQEVMIYPAYDWGTDTRFPSATFRVLGMPDPGTFAEFICVPAGHVVPKPDFLSWEQAAAFPLAGLTAWRALMTQAAAQPGETVLVTGIGGGVATFAMKWAIALGAKTFITSGNAPKLEQARRLGTAGGIDYHVENWPKQLAELTGGVDVVIDGTGGANFPGCFSLLKPGGRLVVYGSTAGNPPTGLDLVRLFFRQARIIGSTMGSPTEFAAMLEFVVKHRIEPVIDRVFRLDEAIAAHQHLLAAQQLGKIVLRHET